ncbi:uncharacterized protein [Physcomitrium patens]|uniref:J domain-containing protein n=2 Tax=Physcomitrium patens TaxID=3218 RepID=A0A7I4D098_PHYPA|nr:auxilin-related protein 1-like isoform X1 [Physcomitrium patens]|eukprot:XP_024366591.1 auxilin-related protein 1-like isoform X1 [Physcomitrella patens]
MDDFANLLHQDYGLKPSGKSMPMAGGVGSHSGGAGSGAGGMGRSGSASRMASNEDVFDSIFNPPLSSGGDARSSSSRSIYDDLLGGPPMASRASNDTFGDLLDGFNSSGSRSQSIQDPFADDLLGGFSAVKPPQPKAYTSARSLDGIFSEDFGHTRTSSHTSSASHNIDDPFSAFDVPKPKLAQSQTMFSNEWNFSASKSASRGGTLHSSIDGDLLGGFSTSAGRSKQATPSRSPPSSPPRAKHSEPVYDDILPGFGGGDRRKKESVAEADAMRGIPIITTDDDDDVFSNVPSSTSAATPDPFRDIPATKSTTDASQGTPAIVPLDADEMRGIPLMSSSPIFDDDPFVSAAKVDPFASIISDSIPPSASYTDPLEPFNMPPASGSFSSNATEGSKNQDNNGSGSYDPLDGFSNPPPVATSQVEEDSTPNLSRSGSNGREGSPGPGTLDDRPSRRGFGSVPFNVDISETPEVASPSFMSGRNEVGTKSDLNGFTSRFGNGFKYDEPFMAAGESNNKYNVDKVPVDVFEENWLSVDDMKLVTSPTIAPPPSRAPPRPGLDRKTSSRSYANYRDSVDENRGRSNELPVYGNRSTGSDVSNESELERERAASREREAALVQKEREAAERERALRQKERERQREREKQREREREREIARQREQEKQREREREIERQREQEKRRESEREIERLREQENSEALDRAKKAAEKAAREAQYRMEKAAAERAIAEARERAERASTARQTDENAEKARRAAEKAAAERAIAEARERAERAALQRAAAAREKEQREKEQKEREEREKRERDEREKRERDERARRERAKEEREREKERREKEEREKERERDRRRDRERGGAEPTWPAGASSRATSEPRQRPPTNQPSASFGGDARRPSPTNPVYSSTGSSPAPHPTTRKPQPPVKIVDDWTTLLTQTAPAGDQFQEIPGETAERRKLRLERHQKTHERAQQALKEKNDRDQAQLKEQAERSMAAGNLDAEIRRWATGKEGNLRALLSSLHLILWPETNWKPVSLTDLITGISVKKSYQRAILCVHPDKVQQKGANVQQKYIAEKVFDLLKEAFARFNSTELY